MIGGVGNFITENTTYQDIAQLIGANKSDDLFAFTDGRLVESHEEEATLYDNAQQLVDHWFDYMETGLATYSESNPNSTSAVIGYFGLFSEQERTARGLMGQDMPENDALLDSLRTLTFFFTGEEAQHTFLGSLNISDMVGVDRIMEHYRKGTTSLGYGLVALSDGPSFYMSKKFMIPELEQGAYDQAKLEAQSNTVHKPNHQP